jgi:hypothetical protein
MRSRPWTAKDAPTHNAALKGKAKLSKLWADTANGTLQSELEKKTSQDKAEGIAVATANKAVAQKLRTVTAKAPSPGLAVQRLVTNSSVCRPAIRATRRLLRLGQVP